MPSSPKASAKKPNPTRKDSREQLVDAALDIILKHGIDGLRIEDVCERVGVTKGSLYWHFNDREGLIREAILEQLRRMSEEHMAAMNDAITSSTGTDQYLLRIVDAFVNPFDEEEVEQRWNRLEMMVSTRRDPSLRKMMAELQHREHLFMLEAVERAAQNGLLRGDVDPNAVAAALVAVSLGSINLSLLESNGPSREAWTNLMLFLVSQLFPPA